jgi:hypothetical protein
VEERGPLVGGEFEDGAGLALLAVTYADRAVAGSADFDAVRVRVAVA